ncbi:hypothetical protein RJ55_01886 [Drechmeria coniospora]|nr:hypothetical protein RJ55_01886 [Drechmeria coniospora]
MPVPPAYHESLPYIDPEPSVEALAAARALVSAELEQHPQPSPADAAAREPSFSPAIAAELDRIASGTAMQPLNLERYEAPERPSADNASSAKSLTPVFEAACVSGSYLAARNENLALLDRHGANAWLLGNYHLESLLRSLERELADTKKDMDLVNATRASRQNDVAAEMHLLDESWRNGVGRVLETEVAIEELKAEVREELKRRSALPAS